MAFFLQVDNHYYPIAAGVEVVKYHASSPTMVSVYGANTPNCKRANGTAPATSSRVLVTGGGTTAIFIAAAGNWSYRFGPGVGVVSFSTPSGDVVCTGGTTIDPIPPLTTLLQDGFE